MGDKPKNRKRKKKNTELKNFYRFQIRDDKMKQLDVLRKKFEEDKERVIKMKEARKFNPF
jgi:ribosomal RNA-processing protein 7